jgi:hypothetical protein
MAAARRRVTPQIALPVLAVGLTSLVATLAPWVLPDGPSLPPPQYVRTSTGSLTSADRTLLEQLKQRTVASVALLTDVEREALQLQMAALARRLPVLRSLDTLPAAEEAPSLFIGRIEGADHFHPARGIARIVEVPGGLVLRLEDVSLTPGLGLQVIIADGTRPQAAREGLHLGRLSATEGTLHFALPVGVDLPRTPTVLLWQDLFSATFAVAKLAPVAS